jgi:hypothetical protein
MLENIKMLLGIQAGDTSKDPVINYWINYYTKMVLKYTHQDTLNADIESIIEQMVIIKCGGIGSEGKTDTQDGDNVKSITRGDYQIVYKDKKSDIEIHTSLDSIAINFQGQLNLWRRLDY